MKATALFQPRILAGLVALLAWPVAGQACAVCFGKSDAALAQGMNMGIFALLIVVLGVLTALVSFFVFLARRAAATARTDHGISASQ